MWPRRRSTIPLLGGLAVIVLAFVQIATQAFVGESDPVAAAALDRLNHQTALLRKLDYGAAIEHLKKVRIELKGNAYAVRRIDNELADLYSNHTLDLEAAIAIDESLLQLEDTTGLDVRFEYLPRHKAANNRILVDREHFEKYAVAGDRAISDAARERLRVNRSLLAGVVPLGPAKDYTVEFLEAAAKVVEADIAATYPGTADRRRFQSRLLKADSELIKRSHPGIGAHRLIATNDLPLDQIDYSEISFLELSSYLQRVARAGGSSAFLDRAIEVIFAPYRNVRDVRHRWTFSKLINQIVNAAIARAYEDGDLETMLYYVSVNKSRMLLEERLASQVEITGGNVASASREIGIALLPNGLPERRALRSRLTSLNEYIDFYLAGDFTDQHLPNSSVQREPTDQLLTRARDFGVEATDPAREERFVDSSLFVLHVKGGKTVAAKRISGSALAEFRSGLDRTYRQLSVPPSPSRPSMEVAAAAAALPAVRDIVQWTRPIEGTVISLDKWLNRHPVEVLLGVKAVRAVNAFTIGEKDLVERLEITGFFNPTGDLPGAEEEASRIRRHMPDHHLFVRDEATLSAMRSAARSPILHLSMHGAFNPLQPRDSKLYFAGAKRGLGANDPNALYARDMGSFESLRRRDLVFAAACQTGLIGEDAGNNSELVGILRPLVATGNRNLILSLWKVDDLATREFVDAFYAQLSRSRDVRQAFFHAQNEVRRRYPSPYFWAPFYLAQSR